MVKPSVECHISVLLWRNHIRYSSRIAPIQAFVPAGRIALRCDSGFQHEKQIAREFRIARELRTPLENGGYRFAALCTPMYNAA